MSTNLTIDMTAAAVGNTDRNHNQKRGLLRRAITVPGGKWTDGRKSHYAHCRGEAPGRMVELLCCELKFQAGESPASSRQLV